MRCCLFRACDSGRLHRLGLVGAFWSCLVASAVSLMLWRNSLLADFSAREALIKRFGRY